MTPRPRRWLALAALVALLASPLYALDDRDAVGFGFDDVATWVSDFVADLFGGVLLPGGLTSASAASSDAVDSDENSGPMIEPTGVDEEPPLEEIGIIIFPDG